MISVMSLQVQGLWKTYQQAQSQIEVLRGLDLSVPTGKTAAILGQSGSGKSTLLSLLAGLDEGDRGSIEINGVLLNPLSVEEKTRFRSAHIGIVFQQFHLIPHLTALENVALSLEIQGRLPNREIDGQARDYLARVQLSGRLGHYPSQLSGGEAQRVALARALIAKPSLILADEPSGSLDLATGELVIDLLFDLIRKEGSSLVLVTHNPDVAARCDSRYVLRGGKCELSP
ncbi:MAG: hypothetical protein C5B49_08765 [Bdellovibrio sp.]|nr:MAG: hypothetical protein C5B49_08765 [Bdellovibrio sp.]